MEINPLNGLVIKLMKELCGVQYFKAVKFQEIEVRIPSVTFFDEYLEEFVTTHLNKTCIVEGIQYYFGYHRVTQTIYYCVDKPELDFVT